jgi:hypothetical protein
MKRNLSSFTAGLVLLSATPAMADPAAFDLTGPSLRASVTRQGKTLPIAAVPQLATGDTVKVEAVLPPDESAHYLLIAGFLREPTNPPPDKWFSVSETWKRKGKGSGPITLSVPAGAQHLVLFLAPETGGDVKTLRDAVKARPGAFVRAAQDLEQASLDRSRYAAYLDAIRHVPVGDLAHVAPVVADSLHIKINEACLQRQSELQATCLLDAKQSVVLGGDGSSTGSTLSGAATDLALSLSATPAGGFGYFSPYISAIHEIVGIFGAMRTAKYQYIPALGAPDGDMLALALNTPPSFSNPKSVLMAALPPVEPATQPDFHPAAQALQPCLGAKGAVLALASAPQLYATAWAHDLGLRVRLPDGGEVDLPLRPDAARGGLVIGDLPAGVKQPASGPLSGTVHGMWGFQPFTGPQVTLQTPGDWHWHPAQTARGDGPLLLTGAPNACVAQITATPAHGSAEPAVWKAAGAMDLAVTLPGAPTEPVTLTIAGPEGTAPAQVTIAPQPRAPQPAADVAARSFTPVRADPASGVAVVPGNAEAIPAEARLSFTLKARGADRFTGRDSVEVSAANGEGLARLTVGSGLTLVDNGVMVASLTPGQALGSSAFGPLHARVVRGGVAGEWLPLGTLVRLPHLHQLTCPTDPAAPCSLAGEGLYLLASLSARRDFEGAVSVADGYPGATLSVPHPAPGEDLYVRLHDAPELVSRLHVGP